MTTAITHQKDNHTFQKVIEFLETIGIAVYFQTIDTPCFLPGIDIQNGSIYVDELKLAYPGDIVHEAGHIAVVPAEERKTLNTADIAKRQHREAEEMMVIAWSFAVCVHLNIDASFVFHDDGYKGGGSSLVENFKAGHYFGVPMLQWTGMALERKNELQPELAVYPAMLKWLRD